MEPREIAGAWPAGAVLDVVADRRGTMNRTWRVSTADGCFALRRYRHRDRDRVRREHALLDFVADAGVPAPRPIPLAGGGSVLEADGRLHALFPWMPGRPVGRGNLTLQHLAAAGECLARVQAALATAPAALVRPRPRPRPVEEALAALDRYERTILALSAPEETDRWLLERLRGRRDWIRERRDSELDRFAALPASPSHGDFHEANLLFEGDRISAVLDWEKAMLAPPAWDAERFLALVTDYEPAASRAFLAPWLAARPTTTEELDAVAFARGWIHTLELWLYAGIYDDGDDRLRRFVRPPPFRASYGRWRRLRDAWAAED